MTCPVAPYPTLQVSNLRFLNHHTFCVATLNG
ncbi:hypothetical protein [Salmonella phage vB_SenS_SB13]|uniref:Uncharacterized protein n=1 Tax=Salmonella phage vB_SenS_SB13 TaxID=2591135 RepID=A0A5J6TBI2_9CAUD|nr:hypothetical protein HWC37_gp130 [Salmonella phage vB_SenS_SB13]QFG07704.1 hypothetical protein [Salmonella phage vB_SenS_SB13]